MKIKRLAALFLSVLTAASAFTGCGTRGDDTGADTTASSPEQTAQTDITTDTEKVLTPYDPGYVIPDEDLTGKNTPEAPLEDDGNGAAIFERLRSESLFNNPDAAPEVVLDRISFARDVVTYGGFAHQLYYYLCRNDYGDIADYSKDMKYAELAVNQRFMLTPADGKFLPEAPVTYGEVLRGLLYVLGYRDHADVNGVAKTAAEVGLSDYIDLAKKNSENVTYAEYAQLVSNALKLDLVLCVEKDGVLSIEQRPGYNIRNAYIKADPPESGSVFSVANIGWDIFRGGAFRYGPSMIINDDDTIDCWLAGSAGVPGEVDWGRYRKSYDHGFTWAEDVGAVKPSYGSEDWNWACDPGVIKIGEYYYAVYTSILWHAGVDNNLFAARSKYPEGMFVEKWNGKEWGENPKPIVTYDGPSGIWGCGEGSMIVVGDTLYLYVSWIDNMGSLTKVYTADATNENWPETLQYRGIAYCHDGGEDSADVKYVDAYKCFISVATGSRFSEDCYVHVLVSYDGIHFRNEARLRHKTEGSNIDTCIHNMGITGDALGHIDIFNKQHYIGYAYQPPGFGWGNWKTRISPIVFIGSDNYAHPENVISRPDNNSQIRDNKNSLSVSNIRISGTEGMPGLIVRSKDKDTAFKVVFSDRKGIEKFATDDILKKLEYVYDPAKVRVDRDKQTAALLVDEAARVYVKYENLVCELTLVPGFLRYEPPVEFYPETETVVFYYKNERKQPGFIARSAMNEYMMLWRNTSSEDGGDTSQTLKRWDHKCVYSGFDKSIIHISNEGEIAPVGIGETTVTATFMGLEASFKVKVVNME